MAGKLVNSADGEIFCDDHGLGTDIHEDGFNIQIDLEEIEET